MYSEPIKVIIRQTDPDDKTKTLLKWVGVAKFDLTKTFRDQLFSRVGVLYHQYSITNHSESILKSKKHGYFNDFFVVVFFLSDL